MQTWEMPAMARGSCVCMYTWALLTKGDGGGQESTGELPRRPFMRVLPAIPTDTHDVTFLDLAKIQQPSISICSAYSSRYCLYNFAISLVLLSFSHKYTLSLEL